VSESKQTVAAAGSEFEISRVFDAPRELVFRAFTEADRMAQWWGPKGFKMLVTKLDLRPGGIFHYKMASPDGHEMWGKFVYREIVPPERVTMISSFSDEHGNVARHPMNPNWPPEMLSTMTLTETGGKTKMTVRASAYNATEIESKTFAEGHDSMRKGFTGTWDQLEEYLKKG
jgi:uncharacterized protein YndB with AHSA1/START domain